MMCVLRSAAACALLCTVIAPASVASSDMRYYVNSVYNPWGWYNDIGVFGAFVDASKARGCNAMSTDVSWATEREDGTYDFTLFDQQVNYVISKGMSVFVRVNCSTIINLPYWFTDDMLMCLPDGSVYRHERGGTMPSIADPLVVDKMVRFFGAVARHCAEAFPVRPSGADPIVCLTLSFSPCLESEYFFEGDTDYSPAARNGFAKWVRGAYPSLADLNDRWGAGYASWGEVSLAEAHPTAKELYFEHTLQALFDRIADAGHWASPRIKVGLQSGCIWDNPRRRIMNVTRILRKLDWLSVADAPMYPHAFSTDYLRCSAPGKMVSNEIDGPWTGGTNEQWLDQAIQTYAHGANALFMANWSIEGLRDRAKWTFPDTAARLARQPVTRCEPNVAIYLSVWDLINSRIGVGTYQQTYDRLSENGRYPVDILPDQVIADNPDLLSRYELIYLPANRTITDEVRRALVKHRVRLVVEQPEIAGDLDIYGRQVERLMP